MSNLIPDDWKVTTLESNAILITDGSHFSPATVDNGLPIATVQNMRSRDFDISSCRLISQDSFDELERGNCLPLIGDVLFSKDGTIGKTFVYRQKNRVVLLSSIAIIRLKQNKLNSDYCSQYLQSSLFYKQLENAKSGSAIRRVVLKDIKLLELPTPPLPEQQKIAKILTSVDDVIEKTQAQIDKLKDLKTGMMQELLTNGIGHTEFKDSPVGRIPSGWEVKSIEECKVNVLDGDRGKEYPNDKDFLGHGHCLFLSAKNVTKSGFSFDTKVFITLEKDELLRKGKLQRNDLVITTRGTLGNIAYFDENIPYEHLRINSGMAILRNEGNILSTSYLNLLLNSPLIIEQTELLAFGSAIPQLTIGLLKNLNVPIPQIQEQYSIVKTIESISSKSYLLIKKLTSLKSTKKALMQDLLTGKVRVNTESTNTEVAVG
ncbi:restriction endonuclease subunit S [Parashewanella spongiae]|uniref:Restriction endonuclease subunit S n=1 Tax=Parashewanella spongiae TaxID=342950 RepID=A0A3A6U8L0_9GAMM|nr:restriction endonuclease subunit S [Parashewanella spongiae]MCL1078620.1 restriction endonuclease subunit S [Parashewanella spongiae]RJY13023.1 restriction endonuclease subunit S [Parashewanella spongiae]